MRPVYLISKTPYPGVTHIPALSIRYLHPPIDFLQYDGVVFTSKQGIEALKDYTIDWERLLCVCVSEATAEYAKQSGAVRIVTAEGYGESIPEILSLQRNSFRWLYLRPETVATAWVQRGRTLGLKIDETIVYETVCNPDIGDKTIEVNGVLIFTSPSSVKCFTEHYPILSTHHVVVIGKTTQKSLPPGVSGYISKEQSVASAVEMAHEIAQYD